MYSVVLMAALATSSSAPEFCHGGCHGCYGGCYGGYGGHGCYGCSGYGCYGCYGCYNGCFGGYAGCYGCYGCYNGCYGCHSGCYAGWGASPYSVWGCYGGWGCAGCSGCYGCYGGYSCYGIPFPGGTTYVSPGMTNPIPPSTMTPGPGTPGPGPGPGPGTTPPPETTPIPKAKGEQARAKVRIELPTDAKLYVDGQLMKTESAVRMFHTPQLAANQAYIYDLKVVIVRDGQSFTDEKQITVRAGETTTAAFGGLEQRATAALKEKQSTPAQTAQR